VSRKRRRVALPLFASCVRSADLYLLLRFSSWWLSWCIPGWIMATACWWVGSECSATADLQYETLRSRHRRTRQPTLAAGPSAYSIRLQYWKWGTTYKVLHDTAPRYLRPLTRVADIDGRRALHSASTNRLDVPHFEFFTIGDLPFPVAASQMWNSVPETVVSA